MASQKTAATPAGEGGRAFHHTAVLARHSSDPIGRLAPAQHSTPHSMPIVLYPAARADVWQEEIEVKVPASFTVKRRVNVAESYLRTHLKGGGVRLI